MPPVASLLLLLAPAPGSESPPALVDPTDIAALVAMALLSIHRIEVRGTDPRAFPRVPREAFDAWHRSAVSAKSLAINACFLKFALNNVWFYVFRGHVPFGVLRAGGLLVFFGWLVVFGYSFVLSSRASKRARELGIVPGRRIIEPSPEGAPAEAAVTETKEAGEASSR